MAAVTDLRVTVRADIAAEALLAIRDATANYSRDEWEMARLLREIHNTAANALRHAEFACEGESCK